MHWNEIATFPLKKSILLPVMFLGWAGQLMSRCLSVPQEVKWKKSEMPAVEEFIWNVKLEMKTTGFFHWLLIHWLSLIPRRARYSVNGFNAEDKTEEGRWKRLAWRDLWLGSTQLLVKCIPDASGFFLAATIRILIWSKPEAWAETLPWRSESRPWRSSRLRERPPGQRLYTSVISTSSFFCTWPWACCLGGGGGGAARTYSDEKHQKYECFMHFFIDDLRVQAHRVVLTGLSVPGLLSAGYLGGGVELWAWSIWDGIITATERLE